MKASPDDLCCCGHLADEHHATRFMYGECDVDGCHCLGFDLNEDECADEELAASVSPEDATHGR